MPYTLQHKKASRQRILESAARSFLYLGYERTGINEIMHDAGMTRGAFYAHFNSKSELYDKAMTYAAANGRFMA
ncbi:MAG: TetR family transcriptional regulator, partial [Candidatus Thiodiazotropha sp. (ex Lucinoma borealis)]|nr:TetR family transcriptional regulator [Candidatus Thiodiazotropha sp. (ex Lucinoma borealis)]